MRYRALCAIGLVLSCCGPNVPVVDTDQPDPSAGSSSEVSSASSGPTTSPTGTVSSSTGLPPSTVTTDAVPPPPNCPGANEGTGPLEAACVANEDCASGVCGLFRDSPPNVDAVCLETPPGCETPITATAVDITSQTPMPGVELRILAALDAITDPAGAPSFGSSIAELNGRVDFNTSAPLNAPFGVFAIVEGPGLFVSGTGLAEPDQNNQYTVGIDVHEALGVPEASLSQWSNALLNDPSIPSEVLPLGAAGGVVGVVRDRASGFAVPGATVTPVDPGSVVSIRYLDDSGGLTTNNTGITGVFIAVSTATTGEDLQALGPSGRFASGTVSGARGIVFTIALDLE